MWKRDEAVKPTSTQLRLGRPVATHAADYGASPQPESRRIERDVVNIGKSVVIKGELNGSEDLTIEGQVEGKIELKDHALTIGPNGKIKAQIFAKSVIVLGEVNGNVTRQREGRHPRRRLGRRRHRLAARGHRRRRALPRQRGHAAERPSAGTKPQVQVQASAAEGSGGARCGGAAGRRSIIAP